MTKLSILICSLHERESQLKSLVASLGTHPDVEILTKVTGRDIPTGTKRNQLKDECQGEYFSFIDDDDKVPPYYVSEMLSAISKGPDVVTFIGYMTTNGQDRKDFTIKLGSRYEEVNKHYYRFPNHLCAFKKSVVKDIRFPDVWVQEDFLWAKQINDRRLLKHEVHIADQWMYHYQFTTNKPSYYGNVKHTRIR